jgi:hypothetical protein
MAAISAVLDRQHPRENVDVPVPDALRLSKRVARQLDRDAKQLSCDWWETELSEVMTDLARSGGFLVALAGVAHVIQQRSDPLWVVGDMSATSAHQVVWEWLDAGIEPADVATWLLAGCWNPRTAQALADAGVRPDDLVGADGAPHDWVDAPCGERLPAAQAAADDLITPADVATLVRTRTTTRTTPDDGP